MDTINGKPFEHRWRMITFSSSQYVEMPKTVAGFNFLKGLRKGRSDLFKHSRIREVIQYDPTEVILGVLHTFS